MTNRYLRAALAAILLTALSPLPALASAAAPPATGVDAQPLDQAIAQHMQQGGLVGIGAAILVDGKVVWMKGYGHADRERGVPFTPDTVMNIGSISKVFTGVAMMRAVEEGRLSLDQDINAYLPFKVAHPHHPRAAITLRQLATHTSGITDRWAVYQQTYHYGEDTPEPLGDFLRSYFTPGGAHYAADNFVAAAPGAQREYSNIGAALAGYIVELATGQPLHTYARERIFKPLRMNHTAWSLAAVDRTRHATLYIGQNSLATPIPLYEGITYPDGGVRTSVAELSRFFAALLGDGSLDGRRVLKPESVQTMRRFQFTAASKPDNVDLAEKNSGLFWQTKFNTARVGHGGSDPGIKTEMLASPDGRVGVIVFSNTSLAGEEMKHYYGVVEEVWKEAEAEAGRMRP